MYLKFIIYMVKYINLIIVYLKQLIVIKTFNLIIFS